jgi:hypothetical protein
LATAWRNTLPEFEQFPITMDYSTLKIIHLTGLALTFMGLAGILASNATGKAPLRKRLIFHFSFGIGLLVLLVTGFALAGALNVLHSAPGWLKAKLAIWLVVGGSMALATRLSRFTGAVLLFYVLLVLTAAWLAIDKPF